MSDCTENQAVPEVNGTEENVENSSADATILQILSSVERTVISHGTSQYQVGGVSACGLAALNCTRIVLAAEQDGPKGRDLLKFVMKARTAQVRGPGSRSWFPFRLPPPSQKITSICAQWSSSSHLEVEDIYKVPLFSGSLKHKSSEFGLPSFERFRTALS